MNRTFQGAKTSGIRRFSSRADGATQAVKKKKTLHFDGWADIFHGSPSLW